ncbi:uncharacterized protein LOC117289887 isoform X2 [Asterias rubens]|uniref:uncharacterized protein LOC117289887 isoform X2 n=1 Tax=Asterias rubens TaxID=7604 RepID=UPI00145585B5|nr:uncharacterized protein LOC117289887 isoform X2 [Asterias rubens]
MFAPNKTVVMQSGLFVYHFVHALCVATQQASPGIGMRATISGIRLKFPAVKNISTGTLQKLLDGEELPHLEGVDHKQKKRKLFLIDSRPKEEYAVSHIANVIQVDHELDNMNILKNLLCQGDSPEEIAGVVVMYCSVGYRSSILVEKLQKAFKFDPSYNDWQVFNLEGSFFKWANENRAIVDEQGQPTNYIHPFSNFWGRLIDKDRWKSTP